MFAVIAVCLLISSALRAEGKDLIAMENAEHSPAVLSREETPSLEWPIKIGLGINCMFVRHESFDVLKSDDVLLSVKADVSAELVVWNGFIVGFTVGFQGNDFRDQLFEEIDVKTHFYGFSAMLHAGYAFWDALFPFVRGGFTGTWLKVDLSEDSSMMSYRKFAPGFAVSAGVELYLPRRWVRLFVTPGLRIEAGYADLGDFKLSSKRDSGGFVPKTQPDLGTVSLRGASFLMSVFFAL